MKESGEQHLPYRATGDVVVLDGDGSRWVREGEATCPVWAEGVPAPVDADGEVVPLDVVELHMSDGEPVFVESICFDGNWWSAQLLGERFQRRLVTLHVLPPDSWEQLEKDIQRTAGSDVCGYYDKAGKPCGDCPAQRTQDNCLLVALRDVMRRTKALAERDAKRAN